jgi:hypothetical protein
MVRLEGCRYKIFGVFVPDGTGPSMNLGIVYLLVSSQRSKIHLLTKEQDSLAHKGASEPPLKMADSFFLVALAGEGRPWPRPCTWGGLGVATLTVG